MQHFIKNRIVVLFIPFVIAFLIKKVCGYDVYSGGTMFIYVLLLFYLLTFLSYKLQIRGGVIVYAGALLYSLGGYCCDIGFGWYVESLGFAYGFLLGDERVKKKLINLLNDYYFMMITSTTTASIILGVSYLKFKQVVFSGDYVLRILLGIALIMWVSSVTYRIKIGNKFSKLLGRISYEIFLLHGFSMSFFSQGNSLY